MTDQEGNPGIPETVVNGAALEAILPREVDRRAIVTGAIEEYKHVDWVKVLQDMGIEGDPAGIGFDDFIKAAKFTRVYDQLVRMRDRIDWGNQSAFLDEDRTTIALAQGSKHLLDILGSALDEKPVYQLGQTPINSQQLEKMLPFFRGLKTTRVLTDETSFEYARARSAGLFSTEMTPEKLQIAADSSLVPAYKPQR